MLYTGRLEQMYKLVHRDTGAADERSQGSPIEFFVVWNRKMAPVWMIEHDMASSLVMEKKT